MLSAGRANAIGVATMEPLAYPFEDPFARRLMAAISQAWQERGIGLSLISGSREKDIAWTMESALVDGFILFCLTGAKKLIQRSRDRRLPFIALDLGGSDDRLPSVGIDNRAGAHTLTQHLLDLGHRHFAVLAMEMAANRFQQIEVGEDVAYHASKRRLEGTFTALRERSVEPATVPVIETLSDEATIHPALEALFAAKSHPTAIIAQSDLIALITLDWLAKRGIAVPTDVSCRFRRPS
ncbi:sugar binding domain of LacI family protein [Fulvimarina manganoxydans]|uniref:Sugar binding domain of LacI family protein n=1 Tax=Fulvimarina manganoxydans TaxID=937218 RepID=A0A1W2BN11_9HYPH|nr:sugar binding domain of LacI family protein [Fulvimarina manganoxydans]